MKAGKRKILDSKLLLEVIIQKRKVQSEKAQVKVRLTPVVSAEARRCRGLIPRKECRQLERGSCCPTSTFNRPSLAPEQHRRGKSERHTLSPTSLNVVLVSL